jgi:hypothetical protein
VSGAVFALTRDGTLTLAEADSGADTVAPGWYVIDRQDGRDVRTFHYLAHHYRTLELEILRRLTGSHRTRTDFCDVLLTSLQLLRATDTPVYSLAAPIWDALADTAWVFAANPAEED